MSLIHMIMLITCLRDLSVVEFLNLELNSSLPSYVQCGQLSSVVDFLELIGAESDHTPKKEIISGGIFYWCANLQKIWS
jgi:hypothetical protein